MTVLITHRCAALLLALFFPAPASAIVGAAEDAAAYADRVVMVLTRGPEGSAFCTGLVLDPRHVLTAAHCLRPPKDTLVLFRDPGDVPAIMLVRRTAPHPDYRRDAIRQRTLSIDVGLLETAAPLPARFRGAPLTTGAGAEIGETLFVTGFGVTREGAPKSGGRLKAAHLAVRAPASKVLLWLAGPPETGACSGDSGAPVFSADGETVEGVVAWTEGPGGHRCGTLTQAVRLAPLRSWIGATVGGWEIN